MELKEALRVGNKLARYFVYQCEGKYYTSLVDRLRQANTRSNLVEGIYTLVHYGRNHLKIELKSVSQRDIDHLFRFIRTGNIEVVKLFHSSLSTHISNFEVEKIRKQEHYLLDLLGEI